MGCPVGIGPEIILRLFAGETDWRSDPVWPVAVVGNRGVLERASDMLGVSVPISSWQPGESVPPEALAVLEVESPTLAGLQWGHPDVASGLAMARSDAAANPLALLVLNNAAIDVSKHCCCT